MPWNGSGSYVLPPAFTPEVNGTIIDAARYNGALADIAVGVTAALAKNGENTPTANLPMAGFKHTGAGAANASGQYLLYGQSGAELAALTISGAAVATQAFVNAGFLPLTGGLLTGQLEAETVYGDSPSGAIGVTIGRSGADYGVVGHNIDPSNDIAGQYKYRNNDFLSFFRFTAGGVEFITAPSGTAGNVATLTTRLVVDSSGRLSIPTIHNNAAGYAGTTQFLGSGNYVPIASNFTNVASATTLYGEYVRMGITVMVAITVGVLTLTSATAGTATSLTFSLPIASATTRAIGSGTYYTSQTGAQNPVNISTISSGEVLVRWGVEANGTPATRELTIVFFYEVV